jgi:hypothetical protein
MFFHNTYPKEGVVCNNALFPFCFLPNPKQGDNMGKTSATLQLLNLFSIGKISIGKKKKGPWNIFVTILAQILACLCRVYKVFGIFLSLLTKFEVFVQTLVDEEVIPLNGVVITFSSAKDACK